MRIHNRIQNKSLQMQIINLNSRQISQLITDQFVKLTYDEVLELHNNELILNSAGKIYNINNVNMQFIKRELENEHVIKYIQNLICEHLNLNSYEVIFSERSNEEFEFNIRLAPNIETHIIVCDSLNAAINTRNQTDHNVDIFTNATQIGLYKRLGNSAYYFRWIDGIL